MVCKVCGQNPLVRAKKAFFGKKPFLGRVVVQKLPRFRELWGKEKKEEEEAGGNKEGGREDEEDRIFYC